MADKQQGSLEVKKVYISYMLAGNQNCTLQ